MVRRNEKKSLAGQDATDLAVSTGLQPMDDHHVPTEGMAKKGTLLLTGTPLLDWPLHIHEQRQEQPARH